MFALLFFSYFHVCVHLINNLITTCSNFGNFLILLTALFYSLVKKLVCKNAHLCLLHVMIFCWLLLRTIRLLSLVTHVISLIGHRTFQEIHYMRIDFHTICPYSKLHKILTLATFLGVGKHDNSISRF